MALVILRAQQKELKLQRPAALFVLLACAVASALLPITLMAAAHVSDNDSGPTSSACLKHASALESALQRDDGERAQSTISDFFSRERALPLKRCFLFRAGTAFHSIGHSATCWTMFSAFFDAYPGHEAAMSAGSRYAAAYAKGGTCAAVEGHVDAAASLLQLAVRLHPLDSQSWNNLANVYRSMGLTQKALDA